MRPRLFRPALALVLLALAAMPAHAQVRLESVVGHVVTDVRVEVEGQPDISSAARQLVAVMPGQPLRLEDIETTRQRVAAVGRFETRVEVIPEESAAGLVIVFRLWPRHPIESIEFRGNTGLSADDLRQRMLAEFLPASLTEERVRSTAERLLVDEGYLQARVTQLTPTETHEGQHRATLVITVEAGPRAMIRSATVEGESPLARDAMLRRAAAVVGAPFRENAIRDALTAIRDDLGNRGYFAAETRLVTSEVSPDGTNVDVVLRVDAGPRVEIAWDRSADPPPGALDQLVPVKREGSIDPDLLDEGSANILAALRREGYFKAEVAPPTRRVDGDLLIIIYRIVRGPRYRIDHVEIPATLQMPAAFIQKQLNIRRGDVLDEGKLGQALAQIIDEYTQRGYYLAGIDPKYAEIPALQTPTETWVVVHPGIIEGPLGVVTGLAFTFDDGDTHQPENELLSQMKLRKGAIYVDNDRVNDERTLRTYYDDRGYRSAQVEITVPKAADAERVTLTVQVHEGTKSVAGPILVFGRGELSEQQILEDLTFKSGDPIGNRALSESEQKLLRRGIFRRVRVTAEPPLPGESSVRVIVTVEVSPPTAYSFGGGIEVDTFTRNTPDGGRQENLRVSPRGSFQITRRNLGGRNRSIGLFSRLSLKASNDPEGRRFGFPEYRIAGTFQEVRAFETNTDVLMSIASEQAVRSGFNYLRRGVSAEALRHVSPTVGVTGRYGLDFTRRFDEQIPPEDQVDVDRLFPQVRLSTLSTGVLWDLRDNPLAATRGSYITAEFETALRAIGSEVGYVKIFAQASRYRALTSGNRFVGAVRIQTGLARGFQRDVVRVNPLTGEETTEIVSDLPISQRFFAGGSTTVRGFQLDQLAVPEVIDAPTGFSKGGNAMIVLNGELRTIVTQLFGRALAGVVFMDAGNVFAKVNDLDLSRLRATPGLGVRYDSPLGPIRFDIGFKLSRLQIGGHLERRFEFHLSIGEAF